MPAIYDEHQSPANATYRNIVATLWAVVGSGFKMAKLEPTATSKTSQHVATGWPNASQHVAPNNIL